MSVIEFTIICHDRVGELARVVAPLAQAKINIRGCEIAAHRDYSELRLIVEDVAKTKKAFAEKGIAFTTAEVIAVELENTPGELYRMAKALADGGISIMYIYPLLDRTPLSVAIMRVPDKELDGAIRLLEKEGFSFIVEHGPEQE